jgi:hypothetical protein
MGWIIKEAGGERPLHMTANGSRIPPIKSDIETFYYSWYRVLLSGSNQIEKFLIIRELTKIIS